MAAKYQRSATISRRRVLELTGIAGIGTIAGCLGGDDDDSDLLDQELETVDVDYNENYEEEMNEAVPGGEINPYNGEHIFNPYHTSWNQGEVQETSFEYLAIYSTEQGEFIPRIAENWEIDEQTSATRIEISDEYGWSDGSQITSADFVTALKLSAYLDQGIETYVDPADITTDGDYAFELQPREEYQDIERELWHCLVEVA